jgi:hypothetical protein
MCPSGGGGIDVCFMALPGQLVMVDMWALGAPGDRHTAGRHVTNARFLPMT